MIISQSDDSPEKYQKFEDINVYLLIPEAKPVISPGRKYSNQIVFPTSSININRTRVLRSKNLFNKFATVENGFHFSSHHQSGNIQSVKQVQDDCFRLRVRTDTNSKLQSQWFYFKVKGIKKGTFIIDGFKKKSSLHNQGMKICIKEEVWKRGGYNISYYKDGDTYALKFEYLFKNADKITEIAYCYPYSYTELTHFINDLITNKIYKKIIKKEILCQTQLNNDMFCLRFTENINKSSSKPIILITSRVHPGQTVSSYVLRGFINTLLTDSNAADLLKYFQIIVVPMLNPDGVKLGNYRFSYTGRDLNRQWKNPSRFSVQIQALKAYIDRYSSRINMVIDLHGHSRKKDVFFYGCESEEFEDEVKKFPYLMSKISSYYSYQKCCFKVQKSKEGTARIYLWKTLKIPFVYTLECSFCGVQKSLKNFDIQDLECIGSKLVEGLHLFYCDKFGTLNNQELASSKEVIYKQFYAQKAKLQTTLSSSGSDSQPSEGKLQEQQILKVMQQLSDQKPKRQRERSTKTVSRNDEFIQQKTNTPIKFRSRVNSSLRNTRDYSKIDRTLKRSINKNTNRQDSLMTLELEDEKGNTSKPNQQLQPISLSNINNANFLKLYNYKEKKVKSVKLFNDYQMEKYFDSVVPESKELKDDSNASLNCHKIVNNHFGAQYTRVKNYAQKLRFNHQKIKFIETPIDIPVMPKKMERRQLKQIKISAIPIKPLKRINQMEVVSERIQHKK